MRRTNPNIVIVLLMDMPLNPCMNLGANPQSKEERTYDNMGGSNILLSLGIKRKLPNCWTSPRFLVQIFILVMEYHLGKGL